MEEDTQGKKRKRQPHLWKSNIRKTARLKGEQYVNSRGIVVPAVHPGPLCR